MSLREGITTILCVIVLFILIAVLFVVKGKLDDKNTVTNNKTNDGTTIVITYNVDGGEALSSVTIKKGESLVLPTPVRKGYSFVGWYVNGKLVDEDTNFDSNTTLVAKWIVISGSEPTPAPSNNPSNPQPSQTPKKTSFVVTFDSKGGSKISPVTVACNNVALTLPEDPTRAGYTFTGWVDKNNNPVVNGSRILCEDITLYATWKQGEIKQYQAPTPGPEKTVTIRFRSNGGTEVADQSYMCGFQANLPYPTKTNYFFQGWFSSDGKEYSSGMILPCEDMILFARWQLDPTSLPEPTTTPTPCAGGC